jgi:fructose-1,6-bisphosphatase/inositol monophosphatase family enzyme/ADP-ribose pyrophosphatase YjhB (NUDIX family)
MKIINFIILDKKTNYLYIQKSFNNQLYFPDQWKILGDQLKQNETIIECIHRKLFEETNLILNCVYGKIHEFILDDKQTINMVYLISASGRFKTKTYEISKHYWINKHELENLIQRKDDIYISYLKVFNLIEQKNNVKNTIINNLPKWLEGSKKISDFYFKNKNLLVEQKLDGTPVSIADREIESFLKNEIYKVFPEYNFIGEENEYDYDEQCNFKWVIDPIDGTRSFIVGRPTFGVLISLVYNQIPIFGCIFQPFTNEIWTSFFSEELYYNNNLISNNSAIYNNIESFTSSPEVYKTKKELKMYNSLKSISNRLSYNGDCYAYGLLSLGFVNLIVEKELDRHDYCALVPILSAANILFFSWEGIPIDYSCKKTSTIAFNSYNFDKLINLLIEK